MIQNIKLSQIKPSPTNPRKNFKADEISDLAKSIQQVGLINPITVRALNSNVKKSLYEVVAGEKRYRAAIEAGLKEIECNIRDLTDDQVIEIQITENLQRSDVHPLDEAVAYSILRERGYTTADIALKVGKTDKFVLQRLQLNKLTEQLKELFYQDVLNIGQAFELARMPFNIQEEITKKAKRQWSKEDEWNFESAADLRETFQERYVLRLKGQPFNLDDPALYPEAGACSTCPKRTLNNPGLFDDITEGDSCLDRDCLSKKRSVFLEHKKSELEKKGIVVKITSEYYGHRDNAVTKNNYTIAKSKNECTHTMTGIYVDDSKFGKTTVVCTNKKCKVHKDKAGKDSSQIRMDNQQKEKKEKAKKVAADNTEILNKVIDTVGKKDLSDNFLRMVARKMYKNGLDQYEQALFFKRHDLKPIQKEGWGPKYEESFNIHIYHFNTVDLLKILAELCFIEETRVFDFNPNVGYDLRDFAEIKGIDLSGYELLPEREDDGEPLEDEAYEVEDGD